MRVTKTKTNRNYYNKFWSSYVPFSVDKWQSSNVLTRLHLDFSTNKGIFVVNDIDTKRLHEHLKIISVL